jgi:hypothetical protein
MSTNVTNKILVNLGSIVAANGTLLLIAPARFAALRTSSWTPQSFDTGLERLAARRGLARGIGTAAACVGLLMVAYGVTHTRP